MSSSRFLQVLTKRSLSLSALRTKDEIHPGYAKLRKLQEHFQKDDGKPVHLKGPFDSILYRSSAGLVIFGTVAAFYNIYLFSQK